mgnify:CR=1 FL=1
MKSEKLWTLSSEPTDYGFENGLRIAEVDGNMHRGESIQIATPEDMRRLSKEPYNSEYMNRIVEQVKNPRYIRGLGGVGIETAIIGNVGADKLQVVLYGWGGNFRHPNALREAIAMTYNDPNAAYMVINMPGVGNSGMLPKSVRKKIRETGSYDSLGEYTGPVLDYVSEDYDSIVVGGHSLGARVATASVSHMDSRVDELRLFDPVGSRNMGLVALGANFIGKEGLELMRYDKESLAPSAKELGLQFLTREDPKYVEVIEGFSERSNSEFIVPKQGWRQQFLTDTFALSKDGFAEDLLRAAPNVQREINIFTPEGSHLTNMRNIAHIVGIVNGEPRSTAAEVRLFGILDRHTHNAMNIPAALALIYSLNTSKL